MDKLTPQDVYLIRDPKEDFQRTDEFVIMDKQGNVIHYLELKKDMIVLTKEHYDKNIKEAYDNGIMAAKAYLLRE